MTLTIAKINSIKLGDKGQKYADGSGLYLFAPAKNSSESSPSKPKKMSWRFDYRFASKRYTLSLGLYPLVGLADARNRLQDARRLLESNTNPAQCKREAKLLRQSINADSFESLADSWYKSKEERRSKAWKESNTLYLKRDLKPKIGSMPITQVSKALLAEVLESTKRERGVKTADRVRQTAVQVFDYAIRKSKAEINPGRLLMGWEEIPPKVSHLPLSPELIPQFLDRVDAYPGQLATKLAIKLLLLTFVRKTELIEAEWDEIDLPNAKWLIPAARMKMQEPHLVPLSTQSVDALLTLQKTTEKKKYLFPGQVSDEKPMSHSTLNVAFRKMGYGSEFSPHGVRSTASTWLNERGFRADVIERQLAHAERNRIRAVYNKADYIPERTEMMQVWADFVDGRP
ncbi:Integrase [Polaromonas sp. OV174]|uniref:tyrosine-type recombinase/integrase n=1 Tax=Polaromonas sp. OV174 TaxID=1855300 RepID=UPI0008F0DB89|nr:tyrosine-type recombinase/integrase [Polaromonas sp. OV174]SFC10994.1 Integrase [Polaromonas sp. OV174]